MKIRLLPEAERDLEVGADFYEAQQKGLGAYFLSCLISDIESLRTTAGVHRKFYGLHRLFSKRFPFAIYYQFNGDWIEIISVLDSRQAPEKIRARFNPST